MADDARHETAFTALNRFGAGARAGDLDHVRTDPQGALLQELTSPGISALSGQVLESSEEAMRRLAGFRRVVETARLEEKRLTAQPMMAPYVLPPPRSTFGPSPEHNAYLHEVAARLAQFQAVPIGFVERLVLFWSNHFAVSVKDGTIRMIAGSYEREAIRPHVLGRFADMAKAVAQHPAMLLYLDNNTSVGAHSLTGLRDPRRGLNENMAREMLELHTLGPGNGYTQVDVIALANILTGWTIASADADSQRGGRFTFAPAAHEPGSQMLHGRLFVEDGLEQGEAAIEFLATQPATARHVARKLARHFVADQPPAALVERLAATFQETDGDLREICRTLIASPEAWHRPAEKLRSPQEFLMAALRLTGRPDEAKTAIRHLQVMGQPFWHPASPSGYPDQVADWLSPTGLLMRVQVADQISRLTLADSPLELVDEAFGGAVSPETLETVRRAGTRHQAIALLLMSREFQRR